jgi:glycosyltransferase involved in cell wall biosynthesis
MLRQFPEIDDGRCVLVPNGWDPTHVHSDLLQDRPAENDLVELSYVGALKSISGLHSFLVDLERALAACDDLKRRLRVRFVGRRAPSEHELLARFPISGTLLWDEHRPLPDAMQLMAESDALLVLTTPETSRALHSKVFNYLAARRPVIVYGSPGETSEVVRAVGAGVFVPAGSPDELGNALAGLAHSAIRRPSARLDDWLEKHTRQSIASSLYDSLDAICARAEA